ncbi:hypothetical protein EBI01_09175 [Marinomonas rhizomae]|uniref:Uncharacterized protein n=1 Tax=Marinomonas rhizomae TaxID=491948 RepID=A0A366JCE0_9GAMM|nr:hypothetical protein [Marinomonas rhizomae]RBP83955.1 hypothetical protein DFP80_105276 [Marinomonas rhizomae]RNF73346.1 hypothetical protein EBI01_09175 [Marinomonas rhizomae]
MKVCKNLIFIISSLCSATLFAANPSINELNSCLALVEFVDSKLDNFTDNYDAEDMTIVHGGLSAYKDFLQIDVITPKLLNLYGGNESQATLMQRLFDRQRATFFRHLNERYSEKKLFTEYAAAINDCTAKTRIRPDAAKRLHAALDKMIIMARQNQ